MNAATGDGAPRTLVVEHLVIDDPEVLHVLGRYPEDEHGAVVAHMLAVGARGLRSMGLSVGLDDIDSRVRRSFEEAATRAQVALAEALQDIVDRATHELDPQRIDSAAGQTLGELDRWRRQLLDGLDPERPESHPGRLLSMLEETVGEHGALELRIRQLLDPHGSDSASAALATALTARLAEVRDLIAEDRGRRQEAARGTQKGVEFEDVLETRLRELAAVHGWWVERTSAAAGALHADSKVGDLVVHLDDQTRIVVEAKTTARITLTGPRGILSELDRAMVNRRADMAVCVSAEDAFPTEVGAFGVYGDRILTVDDGTGAMLAVALRWARFSLAMKSDRSATDEVDREAVAERLQRIRGLIKRFSGTKRSLTQISNSVDEVRQSLDVIRVDVVDQLNELDNLVARRSSNVIKLAPVESL